MRHNGVPENSLWDLHSASVVVLTFKQHRIVPRVQDCFAVECSTTHIERSVTRGRHPRCGSNEPFRARTNASLRFWNAQGRELNAQGRKFNTGVDGHAELDVWSYSVMAPLLVSIRTMKKK